jgi:teichuronic acid biosynthesis glycosyltransferase TuaG
MSKLISVIIPYYKKINFIFNAINSVLNQTYKNFEIIIVYDDPNKSDLKVIKKKFNNISCIKYICNNKNFGVAYSRNLGIKYSKGIYCAFLDSDDTWNKNKLKKQINFMDKYQLNFSFTSYEKKINNKKILSKSKKNIIKYEDLLSDCPIGLSTVILKKKTIPRLLFPLTKTQEDLGAWLKLTKKNIYAYYFNQTLTVWNSTPNSLSKNTCQKFFDLFTILKMQEKMSFIKTIFCIVKIAFNSIKRKI